MCTALCALGERINIYEANGFFFPHLVVLKIMLLILCRCFVVRQVISGVATFFYSF